MERTTEALQGVLQCKVSVLMCHVKGKHDSDLVLDIEAKGTDTLYDCYGLTVRRCFLLEHL